MKDRRFPNSSHEVGVHLSGQFRLVVHLSHDAVYAVAVAAGLGAKELPADYELFRAKRT